jgi:hypothetical protein
VRQHFSTQLRLKVCAQNLSPRWGSTWLRFGTQGLGSGLHSYALRR